MCTSSEGTGVRNGAAKVSRFSRPNHIHTKVRIRWISHALPGYKDTSVLRKYITNTNELLAYERILPPPADPKLWLRYSWNTNKGIDRWRIRIR